MEDLSAEPTLEELQQAINSVPLNKASGNDSILLKFINVLTTTCLPRFIKFYIPAGMKMTSHKILRMRDSYNYIKTRVTEVNVITTEVSLS